jgi:hypothetical protein
MKAGKEITSSSRLDRLISIENTIGHSQGNPAGK